VRISQVLPPAQRQGLLGFERNPGSRLAVREHCGSTLLLDMLKAHPRVYAGFEVGLLFANALDAAYKATRAQVL